MMSKVFWNCLYFNHACNDNKQVVIIESIYDSWRWIGFNVVKPGQKLPDDYKVVVV